MYMTTHLNGRNDMTLMHENLAREQMSARLGEAQQLRRGGRAEAYVATNVVYAPPQEFFPYEHAHGESPYMRPALDESRDTVERTFRTGLEQVIQKAGTNA